MQSVISTKNFEVNNYKFINHTIKIRHKELLEGKLFENMHLVSKNLLKFKNKKYLLLHIKYYDNSQNDLSGSKARQTNDFIKITKILKFLKKKKYEIIVLGDIYDKSIPFLKDIVHKEKLSHVKFFKDYSPKYKIIDQVFMHYHSQGGFGNDSGAFVHSWFLKKKIIHFDTIQLKEHRVLAKNKNLKFLYKKIYSNSSNDSLIKKKIVIHNSYEDIKRNIYNHLIK